MTSISDEDKEWDEDEVVEVSAEVAEIAIFLFIVSVSSTSVGCAVTVGLVKGLVFRASTGDDGFIVGGGENGGAR